jgi:hypothetical protein
MAAVLDVEVHEKLQELLDELSHCLVSAMSDLSRGDGDAVLDQIEECIAIRYSIIAAFPQPLAECYEMFRHCELLARAASRWSASTSDAPASRQEVLDDLQRALLEIERLPDRYPEDLARPLTESLQWLRDMLKGLEEQAPAASLPARSTPERLKEKFLQSIATDEPLQEYFTYLDLIDAGLVNAMLELEKSPPDLEEAIDYLELARQNQALMLSRVRACRNGRLLAPGDRHPLRTPLSRHTA